MTLSDEGFNISPAVQVIGIAGHGLLFLNERAKVRFDDFFIETVKVVRRYTWWIDDFGLGGHRNRSTDTAVVDVW